MDLMPFKLEIITLKDIHSVSLQSENPETLVDELAIALNEGVIKLNISKSPDLQSIVLIPREKIEYIKISQMKEIING